MRAVIFALVAGVVPAGTTHAQPTGDSPGTLAPSPAPPAAPATTPSPADLARASELYQAATRAMSETRFADAVRDFTAAYELTRDPVLFFKIGSAHERRGDCPTAVSFYRRYLAEARPEPVYIELTNERIAACGPVPEPPATGSASPTATPASPAPPGAPATTTPAAAGNDTEPPLRTSRNKDAAWLLVGGVLTFVTAGAVLAYSTGSAEQDLRDLYTNTGFGGRPPTFDTETREQYDALVAEGRRYEVLAWTSFGIATACAAGATYFFWRASQEPRDVSVTPMVTPTTAGVSAGVTVRF